MKVVLLAWGNEARGDDGLGPALAEHVATHWPEVQLVIDDQLQLEHALDLRDADLALFVDAARSAEGPFRFDETAAKPGLAHTSHALSPECLLGVAVQVGVRPPPSFVLAIAGEQFELGEPLSERARRHLDAAIAFTDRLLRQPDPAVWRGWTTARLLVE